MKYYWQYLILLLVWMGIAPCAQAITVVFEENFDQLPLRGPVDENSNIQNAFTPLPPDNWVNNSDGIPGQGNPDVGVREWEGWSFANKAFWIEVSEDERRSEFKLGRGTVAVADPDEWNDLGDPANELGFYNTFLETPTFSISSLLQTGDRLRYAIDSSWIPQCCDDGEGLNPPNLNNKTATIRAIFEDGSSEELLHWESAPFIDSQDRPSTDPQDDPNPFFKSIATNERLHLDLMPLLTTQHTFFKLEFGLTNAGDDWWWAMDNMQMISLTTVPGDMDLSGVLDADDIDDFAQAMHSTNDYINTHFGEFPATRGSVDDTFDFDDIDWFVGELNDAGIAASYATITAAIEAQAIPEPTTAWLVMIACGLGCSGFRTRRIRE